MGLFEFQLYPNANMRLEQRSLIDRILRSSERKAQYQPSQQASPESN